MQGMHRLKKHGALFLNLKSCSAMKFINMLTSLDYLKQGAYLMASH